MWCLTQCVQSFNVSVRPVDITVQRAHFLSVCVKVSQANTHQYCFSLFICYTLLVFSENVALVEAIILLPHLRESGFYAKLCSQINLTK